MPRRLTNDLLLCLVLAQVLGGVVGWSLPISDARPLYDVHRVLGVGLMLLLGWKQAIALASLRRRAFGRGRRWDRSIVWGSVAAVALLLTVAIGLAWTLNLISFDLLWGYSPLNVHVIVGIGLVPLVGWHMVVRRRANRLSAPLASRRALLRVGGLSLATLVGWQAIEQFAPPVRLPTGSKQTDSLSGNAFPAEIWLFDSVPTLRSDAWSVDVLGERLSMADLARFPRCEVRAVLDCTSGWWSEQVWSGVALHDVVGGAEMRNVAVTSVTGHRIVLPLADLQQAVLATHVGGEVISAGHGFPVRLVVPGRRGYHWVKWVARIEAA